METISLIEAARLERDGGATALGARASGVKRFYLQSCPLLSAGGLPLPLGSTSIAR